MTSEQARRSRRKRLGKLCEHDEAWREQRARRKIARAKSWENDSLGNISPRIP